MCYSVQHSITAIPVVDKHNVMQGSEGDKNIQGSQIFCSKVPLGCYEKYCKKEVLPYKLKSTTPVVEIIYIWNGCYLCFKKLEK